MLLRKQSRAGHQKEWAGMWGHFKESGQTIVRRRLEGDFNVNSELGQSSEDRVFSRRKPHIKSPRGRPVPGVLGKEGRSAWRQSRAGRGQGSCRSPLQPCPGDVYGVFKDPGLVPGAVGSGGRF